MSTPFNNIGASLIPVFNTHASATESQRGAGDAQKTLSDSASAMNAVGETFVQKDTPKHLFGLVQRQLGIGSATLGFVKGCQEGDAGAVISSGSTLASGIVKGPLTDAMKETLDVSTPKKPPGIKFGLIADSVEMIVDIGKGVQQNDLKQVALSSVKLGAHVLTKGSPFAMLTLNLGMDAVDTIAKDPQGYSRYLNQTRQLARAGATLDDAFRGPV
ncbi:hypothetical protein [Achromobacter sp. 413638]|uniref:hypothetical protein n=1 Tax=Achromobacter sp. 413638 TaxID=3342385 RepID=UPI003248AE04